MFHKNHKITSKIRYKIVHKIYFPLLFKLAPSFLWDLKRTGRFYEIFPERA